MPVQRLPRAGRRHERGARPRAGLASPTSSATSASGDIDAVVLSHRHPDHWIDLTGLDGRLEVPPRSRGAARVRHRRDPASRRPTCSRASHRRSTGTTSATATVSPSAAPSGSPRTDHYVETLAVRVDDLDGGRSLAYSADTGPDWSFARLGDGDRPGPLRGHLRPTTKAEGVKHLSAGQAGAMARAAGVPRLLLTHFWPGSTSRLHAPRPAKPFGAPGHDRHPQREVRPVRADGRAPDELRDVPSSATSPTQTDGSVLVTAGAPWCCAPRRSTRACRAGCGAPARAGSPPSTRCCRAPRTSASAARSPRAAPAAAPTRSSASSAGRCGRCATWSCWASGRSSSTATCCRPTVAPARRRSPAATSRCTTPLTRLVQAGVDRRPPAHRGVRRRLGRHRRRHAGARPALRRGLDAPRST